MGAASLWFLRVRFLIFTDAKFPANAGCPTRRVCLKPFAVILRSLSRDEGYPVPINVFGTAFRLLLQALDDRVRIAGALRPEKKVSPLPLYRRRPRPRFDSVRRRPEGQRYERQRTATDCSFAVITLITVSKAILMPPKIGVALGSGAARGWSLIGVLEGLAALGVVPEVVSGTSIGALVGAAFVTGKLAALKARIENFSRRDVAAMLDLHLTTGGLVEGKRVENYLDSLGIAGSIEALRPRYAAVATDLASGREIWLQQGPIGRAVRASISIPGIFSPVRQDDRWLIDGGLVNPVPVSLARALGADIVIAVDLNSELVGRRFTESDADLSASPTAPAVSDQLPPWLKDAVGPILQRVFQAGPHFPSLFEVLANSLNIMQDRITRTRLAGDPPDVLLCPRLGKFFWLDFHRANEAIAKGLACVQDAEPVIRRACRGAIASV